MWQRILKSFLIITALAYAGMMAYLYFGQASMIYLPDLQDNRPAVNPSNIGLAYEDIRLVTSDKIGIHAWYVPGRKNKPVILFCHGNAGNISHRLGSISMLNEKGLNVLIFDYRGYGLSEGKTTEHGSYLDAAAAWDYLINKKGFRPEEIVIFGRSLGGAIAANLASRHHPGAVILESTFTSVPDMAAEYYPWLPVYLLTRINYDSLTAVKSIEAPLLVLHSRDDEIIPFRHGKALFLAANEPKQFFILRSDHNNSFRKTPGYDLAIAEFIKQYVKTSPAVGVR